MINKFRFLIICIACIHQSLVLAIGLGDIEVNSKLNENFKAKINIISANQFDMDDLNVSLASFEDFKKAGITYSAEVSWLKFEVAIDASGSSIVNVTSDKAIKEPYLNFLVKLNYPKGKLFREFAVLIDPPVVMTTPYNVQNNIASKTVSTPKVMATSTDSNNESMNYEIGDSYIVNRGDTLFSIAKKLTANGQASISQMMIALFNANPEAFFQNNINALNSGVKLNIPNTTDIVAQNQTEIDAIIQSHHNLWNNYQQTVATSMPTIDDAAIPTQINQEPVKKKPSDQPDRLNIVSSTTNNEENYNPSSGSNDASSAKISSLKNDLARTKEELVSIQLDNDELRSRNSELKSMLDGKDELIAIKDDELVALNATLAKVREEQTNAELQSLTGDNNSTEITDVEVNTTSTSNPINTTETPITNNAQEAKGVAGFNWLWIIVLGGVVVVIIGVVFVIYSRKNQKKSSMEDIFDSEDESDEQAVASEHFIENEFNDQIIEELATDDVDSDAEDNESTEDEEAFNEDKEKQLLALIEEDPYYPEHKLELARFYYDENNEEKFIEVAKLLKEELADSEHEIWNTIKAMGALISPSHELFADDIHENVEQAQQHANITESDGAEEELFDISDESIDANNLELAIDNDQPEKNIGETDRQDNIEHENSDEDLVTTDVEPNAIDTKLDLAEAYIDMGDNVGAKGMLSEILEEGSTTQIAKAKDMLEKLG